MWKLVWEVMNILLELFIFGPLGEMNDENKYAVYYSDILIQEGNKAAWENRTVKQNKQGMMWREKRCILMKVGKTTQMIVILIDNECILLNSLSNNESMNCLYILYFALFSVFIQMIHIRIIQVTLNQQKCLMIPWRVYRGKSQLK